MGNPLYALFLAVAGILLPEGLRPDDSVPQPTITITPTPLTIGDEFEISYTGPLPATLDLDWDPAAQPDKVSVDSSGKVKVIVPSGVSSLVVTDPTGAANYVSTVVLP